MKWTDVTSLLLSLLICVPFGVLAITASSTTFNVRQNIQSISGGNSTFPFSTSTSFQLLSAGGQTAVGTSTTGSSFSVYGGMLQNLRKSLIPIYDQLHYHWRLDNGSETTATSAAGSQDTAHSAVVKETTVRLRVLVSNEGGTIEQYTTQQFRLEYGTKSTTCAAIGVWTDVGGVGGDWDMSDSANLTNGADTTNIGTGTGGVTDENNTFITDNNGVLDTASQSGAISISSFQFIELEYSIKANTAAADGANYCFRLTNAGSATNYRYTRYPEATIATALTFLVTHTNFSSVTPGVPRFATSTLSVNAANSTGWNVILTGDDQSPTNTVMDLSTDAAIGITDQTEWIPGIATTSAGNAVRINSFDNSGDVLAFRVMTASGTPAFRAPTWWGTTDSYSDAATTLWAGIASTTASNKRIGNTSVSSGGSPVLSSVLFYLDVPTIQPQGSYDGGITYTATTNP